MGQQEILDLLIQKKGDYFSSEEIAQLLEISTQAVRRSLIALRKQCEIYNLNFKREGFGFVYTILPE